MSNQDARHLPYHNAYRQMEFTILTIDSHPH